MHKNKMGRVHTALYISALWAIGCCLGIIYSLTHEVDGLQIYKVIIEQPAKHQANAADIFEAAERINR